jgi:hypothetical protein
MEQVIIELLGGKLDGATLLMLFIIGILTKRFVPWWVHEEALDKLAQYEDAAPALLDEVTRLIDTINNDPDAVGKPTTQRRRVRERQEKLQHVVRSSSRSSPPRRRRVR